MLALVLVVALVVLAFAVPAIARLKWDLTPVSVVHASGGMGLTNGSLSLHRAFTSRHGMYDSFNIYGTAYTWTRPAETSFLQAGWTYDSIVSCGQCHSWVGATGSVPASGYPGYFETLRLDSNAADGMLSTTGQAVICEKCHDLVDNRTWSNVIHASSKHRGAEGQCIMCHQQLPHGGGLPRILGYAQNPSPYSSASGGLAAIKLQSYTPTSWRKGDCSSSCHTGSGGTAWPSGGSVKGTIRNTLGSPIADATVTVGPITVFSDASGQYGINNLGPGYTNVKVWATGYYSWSQFTMITAGATLTVDAALTPR
jgi:hypothetical protein